MVGEAMIALISVYILSIQAILCTHMRAILLTLPINIRSTSTNRCRLIAQTIMVGSTSVDIAPFLFPLLDIDMKALIKRTKGTIWRTIVGLPVSVLFMGIIYVLQTLLKGFDAIGQAILKEWRKIEEYMEDASNGLTRIAWFVLYLPFMILSLISITLIMYPVWYIAKLVSDKLYSLNINLLLWIEYRQPLPEEADLIQKSVETLKAKLKEQGVTDKQIAEMFDKI